VVPTYNEHENIQELVYRTEKVLWNNGFEGSILIVDDNSPDGTGKIAEELSRRYGNIKVIHRPNKSGIGSAYRRGFQTVLENAYAEIVIQMDGDLSHTPESIPALVEKLSEGFDIVVGSRYIDGGSIKGWPVQRWLISAVANFFARHLLGLNTIDLTSGFRAYHSDALKLLDLSQIRSDNYAFQVELLYCCANAGFKVQEVPIRFTQRSNGKSKLGKLSIIEFVETIIKLSFDRFLRRRKLA